jgi:hypothetical protein
MRAGSRFRSHFGHEHFRDRPETSAVKGGWPVLPQPSCVQAGSIAFVSVKGIAGSQLVIELHEAIPEHFGHDGSAPDDVTALVSVDYRPAGAWEIRWGDCSINQDHIGIVHETLNRLPHGREGRLKNVRPVDFLGGDDAEPDIRAFGNDLEGPRSLGRRQSL